MLTREDTTRLKHMLDHSREAIALLHGKERQDLDNDRLLQLGLMRLIEIVGEAASRVSREAASRYSKIPWPQVVSIRNRLIHGYDFADFDILWQTITEDLPPLVTELEAIIQKQSE